MSAEPFIITLDGPAGVGKSTLAAMLADSLNLPCLDTGAMFRFLALRLGESASAMSASELRDRASQWQFSLEGSGANTRLLANGIPVGAEIRTEEASRLASAIGRVPAVREVLRDAQRQIGREQSLVAEGRDLGTVVFPDAAVKFFLDARPDVRARRRWLELRQKGMDAGLDAITEALRERDEQDRNRPTAPLKPAPDAILIDTSALNPEEVLQKLKACVAMRN